MFPHVCLVIHARRHCQGIAHIDAHWQQPLYTSQCCWNLPQPLHAGVLVGWVGLAGPDIDLARHCLVDDGLLLLLQQLDQPFLGPDVAPDAPVGVIEEADDGELVLCGDR